MIFFFCGLAIGAVIAVFFTAWHFSKLGCGCLRVETSDPDGPFLFLELDKPVDAVMARDYILLDVKCAGFAQSIMEHAVIQKEGENHEWSNQGSVGRRDPGTTEKPGLA